MHNTPAEVQLLMTLRQAPIICRNALKRVPAEIRVAFELTS
jgi:hypothetical protein